MKGKVIAIYAFVGVACVAMIVFFQRVGANFEEEHPQQQSMAGDVGKETPETFFPIEEDLALTRQDGESVMLSDIEGEVTVLAQFFAVCPMCAERNGRELGEIYRKFGDHPDFRIVCISVDPETDGVEELQAYGEALGADPENWWFTTAGDMERTHSYLEEELGFFEIRERGDPVDIASKGRYAHDLGFLIIDRDLNVIGKWPLADARSETARERDPGLYERLKTDMYRRLERELNRPEAGAEGGEAPEEEGS